MWQKLYRQPGSAGRALPALIALLLWMCVAASLVVWGLRWLELGSYRPTQVAALDRGASTVTEAAGGWRVLSPAATPVMAASASASGAWKLLGVVASEGGRGSALLAYGGEAPRTWRVGQSLDGQWRLERVAKGRAWLSAASGDASAPALELQLQTPAAATSSATALPAPKGVQTPPAGEATRD